MLDNWSRPAYHNPQILAGVALDLSTSLAKIDGQGGILEPYDGSTIRQVVNPLGDDDYSDGRHAWRGVLDASTTTQDLWGELRRAARSHAPLTLIDWDREVAEVTITSASTSYQLQRAPYLPFAVGSLFAAWLDGVAAPVVASDTPPAGSVGIVGDVLHTHADDVGSVATLEFIAVYDVRIFSFQVNVAGVNQLTADIELREV